MTLWDLEKAVWKDEISDLAIQQNRELHYSPIENVEGEIVSYADLRDMTN
ncbi:hypothetical protein [Synechocystis salina]|nr:hypothetical protein [Synechocystis salina]